MIVYSMTEKELHNEFINDFENVFRYAKNLHSKFRHVVISNKKFPMIKHHFYSSPQKNNWIIIFEAKNKKEIEGKSRVSFICLIDSPKGFYAITPNLKNKKKLILYAPHFFSRYAERGKVEKTGKNLISWYFTRNDSSLFRIKEKHAQATTEEGIALGVKSSNENLIIKTFITYAMAKGEQVEDFSFSEKIRQEIHDTYISFN